MTQPKILWSCKTPNAGPPPAVGQNGTVYFAPCDDAHLFAMDSNGRELWRYCYAPEFNPKMERSSGAKIAICSDGTVIATCTRRDTSWLFALSSNGKLKWEMSYNGGNRVFSPAISTDGTILFASPGKKLCAFDATGKRKWEFRTGGKLSTYPRLGADGTVFVGTSEKKIYAIGPNGDKKWDFLVGGVELREFGFTVGGFVCLNTYDGDSIILDYEGRAQRPAVKFGGERGGADSPLVRGNGGIVTCSFDCIHSIRATGKTEWSYAFSGTDCRPSTQALASDGSVLVQPNTKTGQTRDGRIIAIGGCGKKLWELELNGYAARGLTLTSEGILYALTSEALYAIQCPSGLADAPWPMDAQNPQRTSCANPKFSQPIAYGAGTPPASQPIEIRSVVLSRPLPEKPFTKQEVLAQLDADTNFPMLDNGYVYPAAARLNAYRDAAGLRWALVIEVVGWNNHQSDHQAIESTLYCYGNWLNQPPGLADDGFLHMTRDGDESSTFDDQDVDPEARELYVREKRVRIPKAAKRYKELGIKWEDPDMVKGYELLRALVAGHRDLFLATEEELCQRVPADLSLVLRLDEWRHPDGEKPSQTEAFQMIAEVLTAGDPKQYRPKAKPNTHWKH